MKTAGIIAEYNPFHKGHEYQDPVYKEKAKSRLRYRCHERRLCAARHPCSHLQTCTCRNGSAVRR
ncbi:MAG: nucleotidyltransferase family protein [Blautia wexlerae]